MPFKAIWGASPNPSHNSLLTILSIPYIARVLESELLSIETPEAQAEAVARAAAVLRGGGVVAVPTETVYGLAANALDEAAVAGIFEAKNRPAENPVIVHVADESMVRDCVANWPETAQALAAAFWPGPLTLVLPKAEVIPSIVTAGGDTVGVRQPRHPFMQELIRTCRFPLAAPSANLSNHLSPTTAPHVQTQLAGRIPLVIDGGAAQVGIESTVVDLTGETLRVLRPGMVSAEAIAAVLLDVEVTSGNDEGTLKSPGQLKRHYAPNARLLAMATT